MSKPNLILLHGALGSQKQFKHLIPFLSQHFQVHTLNFEGHGGSSNESDFSIEIFAENTFAFIQDHQLQGADVFGYSMGGYVALSLAQKHPRIIGKIVTLGTKFNWTPEVSEQESRKLNPAKIEEKVPAFAQMLANIHQPGNWKTVVEKTARMMIGLGNGSDLKDTDLQQIPNEVLITVGDQDQMVSSEESVSAAGSLRHGKFRIIEGFEHTLEKNKPEILASIIIDFLKP